MTTNTGATNQDGDPVFVGASSGGFEVTPDGKGFSLRFTAFDATLEPTAIGAFEHYDTAPELQQFLNISCWASPLDWPPRRLLEATAVDTCRRGMVREPRPPRPRDGPD